MASYGQVIFFSLIGGVFSLIGGVLMLSRRSVADNLAAYATPFAAGALLAAAFMDLLKDGLEVANSDTVMLATMSGIVLFFFAERFLRWFHHHNQHDHDQGKAHSDPAISLIVIGDTIHNGLDGVAIAAAFLVSVPTGIVTTIAVAAHEIPHEIGDFGLLLARGMSRSRVLMVNVASALATLIFAVLTFALGSRDRLPIGALIGVSAGFLLYIAMSDVIPEMHEKAKTQKLFSLQPFLFVLGIAVVSVSIRLAHHFVH